MSPKEFELLKEQHKFNQWAGRNKLGEGLFVDGYFIGDGAVRDWQLLRRVPLSAPGAPVCCQSIWRRKDLPEALLRFDFYECASRLDAHEFLVRFLGEVEASEAGKVSEDPLGDVGFAWLSDFSFAFARANLVMFLSNAGRDRLPVIEHAQGVDADVISKPAARTRDESAAAPRPVLAVAGEKLKARAPVALRVEVPQARGRWMCRKFFSKGGEVERGPEGLVFRPDSPGQARITVYTVSDTGMTGRATQRFAVE